MGSVIRDDEISRFRPEFLTGVGNDVLGFRRKTDHHGRASGTEMTNFGKNVWILCEAKGDGFSVLFDLLIRDVLGTPVRDGSHTDEGVRAEVRFRTSSRMAEAESTEIRVTPKGTGRETGPEISVTAAPRSAASRAMA